MKGKKLIFTVCITTLVFCSAHADDISDVVRAAIRRTQNTSQTSSRLHATSTPVPATTISDTTTQTDAQSASTVSQSTISRVTNAMSKTGTAVRERTNSAGTVSRTAASSSADTNVGRTTGVIQRSAGDKKSRQTASISARSGNTTSSGTPASVQRTTATRTVVSPLTKSTKSAGTVDSTSNRTTSARVATTSGAQARNTATGTARSATNTTARPSLDNQKKCREIYYNCMDELCANKDAQLKRCACSSRISEFNKIKQNLSNVEDKMLTFNQRLLTVNMDKEDAAALYKATEGEIAYNKADMSESKRTLDEIAKKLNTSFDDSNFDSSLTAISLSLNTDLAFDNLDSTQGASATAKSGTALYSAALPMCREMAQEVCTTDELSIAEGGYLALIEQDCNTVYKSYQAQTEQAHTKVLEGNALLDMSRLDIYQKRNSDDLLTCKGKILDKLTDDSVCGSNMGKCLDVSGRYIDPTTGEAFLTESLSNLSTLITRPTGNETWTSRPSNGTFVTFLNSKKKYLSSAMENCQDIADQVWNSFLDDALSQIKIAQDKKLEEVRQSCTTLTTQCLSTTATTISEFDARALSTFGIQADKTVNAMCASVKRACTALMQDASEDASKSWDAGMSEIATAKTYETVRQTCREVGRACIIQACTSISGNFGLCEDINNSINRKSILNRDSCWKEVYDCVASTGSDTINNILKQLYPEETFDITKENEKNNSPFYKTIYGYTTITSNNEDCVSKPNQTNCIENICAESSSNADYRACRITESIWGNCNAAANTDSNGTYYKNQIITTDKEGNNVDTLLAWFAQNTGTANATDSCRDTTCPAGQSSAFTSDHQSHICASTEKIDSCGVACIKSGASQYPQTQTSEETDTSICCLSGITDSFGNCGSGEIKLVSVNIANIKYKPTEYKPTKFEPADTYNILVPKEGTKVTPIAIYTKTISNIYNNKEITVGATVLLVCLGDVKTIYPTGDVETIYPEEEKPQLKCNGRYVSIIVAIEQLLSNATENLVPDSRIGIYFDPIFEANCTNGNTQTSNITNKVYYVANNKCPATYTISVPDFYWAQQAYTDGSTDTLYLHDINADDTTDTTNGKVWISKLKNWEVSYDVKTQQCSRSATTDDSGN